VAITLNHTIVPAHDKESSAQFFAEIMGLTYSGVRGHFAQVPVNDALTLDFDNAEAFEGHHLAFHVGEEEFDAILGRLQARGVPYGSGPNTGYNNEINHRLGGRGLYFADANGHSWEILTRV
jgi:catechol 2,3-dioxygenase-like lactoylglutathione lyase family enzyme